MLNYDFKLYAVRRYVSWNKRIEYWNFWTEKWVMDSEFTTDCIDHSWVAESIAKEYNAELVPIKVSIKECENLSTLS